MQMYALACNTSSTVAKRTAVSLINAHCLSSFTDSVLDVECCSVDSGIGSTSSRAGSELPGVAPEPVGKAVYAI